MRRFGALPNFLRAKQRSLRRSNESVALRSRLTASSMGSMLLWTSSPIVALRILVASVSLGNAHWLLYKLLLGLNCS